MRRTMPTPRRTIVRRPKYSVRSDTLERLVWVGIGLQQVQTAYLKKFNLTRLEAEILRVVSFAPARMIKLASMPDPVEPTWTPTTLARRLHCSVPTMSIELGNLETRGLTQRAKGKDRRTITITATDDGKALARAYAADLGQESERIFRGMAVEWSAALDKLESRIPGVEPKRVRRVPVA